MDILYKHQLYMDASDLKCLLMNFALHRTMKKDIIRLKSENKRSLYYLIVFYRCITHNHKSYDDRYND